MNVLIVWIVSEIHVHPFITHPWSFTRLLGVTGIYWSQFQLSTTFGRVTSPSHCLHVDKTIRNSSIKHIWHYRVKSFSPSVHLEVKTSSFILMVFTLIQTVRSEVSSDCCFFKLTHSVQGKTSLYNHNTKRWIVQQNTTCIFKQI